MQTVNLEITLNGEVIAKEVISREQVHTPASVLADQSLKDSDHYREWVYGEKLTYYLNVPTETGGYQKKYNLVEAPNDVVIRAMLECMFRLDQLTYRRLFYVIAQIMKQRGLLNALIGISG